MVYLNKNITIKSVVNIDIYSICSQYKGSILLVCHEPEFYRDVVTDIWNCEDWTTKVV